MTVKFLHIADLHIGKSLNGLPLIDDQRFALSDVLGSAVRNKVDAVVIAGDLYDKTAPSAEAVALLDWFLTEAVERGLAVLIVPGNHDSTERIAYGSELMRKSGVIIAPPYDGSVTSYDMEDEHGTVRFWLLPFLKPAIVRPFFPDGEIGQSYTRAVECAIGSCDIDLGGRNVLIAHQFVTAGANAPERSDSELSVGELDNVDVSLFDGFDYVALGHIHRPQRIGRDEVRYAGSLLKYSFSEIGHEKSAVLVELDEKGDVRCELVPITPLHDVREIKGPIEALASDGVSSLASRTDYLRVILTDEQPAIDALSRIRKTYPNALAIEYDNKRTRHAQRVSEHAPEPELISPMELFERFYEEQNGAKLTERQRSLAQAAFASAAEGKTGGRQ